MTGLACRNCGYCKDELTAQEDVRADLSLSHEAFLDAVEKRTVTPDVRRELVSMMVMNHCLSVREACRTARFARLAFCAPRQARSDEPEIAAIQTCIGRRNRSTIWRRASD